jgi:hypothetical protein
MRRRERQHPVHRQENGDTGHRRKQRAGSVDGAAQDRTEHDADHDVEGGVLPEHSPVRQTHREETERIDDDGAEGNLTRAQVEGRPAETEGIAQQAPDFVEHGLSFRDGFSPLVGEVKCG